MLKKYRILFLLSLILLVVSLSGCGCKQTVKQQYVANLEVWGLFDDRDAFNDIIENYKKINPNVGRIDYRKLTPDTYKKELIEALASGQGPDIFLINNTWLPSFKDKTSPAPAEILNEKRFRNDFVDVAAADFISDGSVYAAPLSVDSLALYYNKDLFNEAGIANPPENWDQFVEDVQKLTKIGNNGNVVQSGAAIGTAYNINRSTDILNLLMLQTGTEMMNSAGKIATFDKAVTKDGQTVSTGENALDFYTQFARVGSSRYTWNPNLHYSVDAFSEGTVAMMFNYSWQLDVIKSKAPKLNFAVAPIPQFSDGPKIDYANYWGFTVSKNKIAPTPSSGTAANQPAISNDNRIKEAWKFVNFLATKPTQAISINSSVSGSNQAANFDPTKSYLEKTGKPAARRDLIDAQKEDPRIGVFAQQNLIAKSWYQNDPESTEAIFAQMIDQVNKGQETAEDAIKKAATQVTQLAPDTGSN